MESRSCLSRTVFAIAPPCKIRAAHEGRRELVVVNTVRQCQELAQQLSDLWPICYHSPFILKDRKRIEADIQQAEMSVSRSRLVVATQVVEVSLDIDFDWLFSECALADALVQRAGRVNRYRDLHETAGYSSTEHRCCPSASTPNRSTISSPTPP